MADFKAAWAISKVNEGGLANNPNDPGGLTWEGISFVNWPSWPGWVIVKAHLKELSQPNPPQALLDQLEPLVIAFYQRYYWGLMGGDFMQSQALAAQLFDASLNNGLETSIEWAQKSCNLFLNDAEGIKVDGTMGKMTINAINLLCSESPKMSVWLLTTFKTYRGAKFIALATNNPKMEQFFKSWISRLG